MVSEGRAEHDHFKLCQRALYEDLVMEGPGWWSQLLQTQTHLVGPKCRQ